VRAKASDDDEKANSLTAQIRAPAPRDATIKRSSFKRDAGEGEGEQVEFQAMIYA